MLNSIDFAPDASHAALRAGGFPTSCLGSWPATRADDGGSQATTGCVDRLAGGFPTTCADGNLGGADCIQGGHGGTSCAGGQAGGTNCASDGSQTAGDCVECGTIGGMSDCVDDGTLGGTSGCVELLAGTLGMSGCVEMLGSGTMSGC